MNTELVLIDIPNPIVVFSTPNGLDAIIDKIEAEVKAIDRDISTASGRDNIRSIAAKLARSKTTLDKIGKELTEEQRKQITAVNAERRRAWDRMEALQHEIRKPLTKWENVEKDRVAADELASKWQEFRTRADMLYSNAKSSLEAMLVAKLKAESEAKELARLRAQEEARLKAENEARIAAEATAKAEALAKEKADALAKQVEAEKQASAERERLATQAREADKVHRAKINNAVLATILDVFHKAIAGSITAEDAGKFLLTMIVKGEIPHVKITY